MTKNKLSTPKITYKQKAALIMLGLFLFLILLEVGLRLGGFILSSIQDYRNSISISKNGAYRIMCLGESTTFSGGKESYPSQLEEVLNQHKSGIICSVINKGMPAANTNAILDLLDDNLNQYKPNMVIAMMGINDYGLHLPYEDSTNNKTRTLFKNFKIYKFARLIWLRIVTKAKEINLYIKAKAEKEKIRLITDSIDKEARNDSAILLDLDKTEESLKNGLELNPQSDYAYAGLGYLYKIQGKFTQAEDSFKKALALNPRNDYAYDGLGHLYLMQGKFVHSEELYRKALELNPKNDCAYAGLGHLYLIQGKFAHSEKLYRKALELNPKNDYAYIGLGHVYPIQGKFNQAEELFSNRLRLYPRNEYVYAQLGDLYLMQNQFAQAEESQKKALELNPESELSYRSLAIIYQEMGKYEISEEHYKKANQLRKEYYNPTTVNSYKKLREILDRRGIMLVCVQYPMRSIEPIKWIFKDQEGVIFVDNEKIFKDAVKKEGYKKYFIDMFGGDFGHCTPKGNRLLAENIANAIIKGLRGYPSE